MKSIMKLALGATLAAGTMIATVPAANAGVHVGIGIGVPGVGVGLYGGHPGRWCYNHPGRCGGYGGPYYEGAYWAGHGYWHGGRWWQRRERWHRGWRYR